MNQLFVKDNVSPKTAFGPLAPHVQAGCRFRYYRILIYRLFSGRLRIRNRLIVLPGLFWGFYRRYLLLLTLL